MLLDVIVNARTGFGDFVAFNKAFAQLLSKLWNLGGV